MSINLTVNGVTYPYPDPNDNNWGQNATDWAEAISNNVLYRSGGSFVITSDVNFGSSFGLIAPYFKSVSSSIASSGVVRLARTDGVVWRNAADDGDLTLSVNASDELIFDGVTVGSGGGGGGASELNGLNDVGITTPSDDQALMFDSGSSEWRNRSLVEADISDFQSYALDTHTHPASDITSGTFTNARISQANVTQHEAALTITESQISDLQSYSLDTHTHPVTDLEQSGAATSDVLAWNGSNWAPQTSTSSLEGLLDTNITTPLSDNEVLAYDTATSDWINQSAAEAGLSEVGHTHVASDIVSGSFANARISQANVTQHEAALTITESQISDLQSYLTAEVNDLTAAVTWANVPDANITQSSVTQHEGALTLSTSQITSGTFADARIAQSNVTQHEDALAIDLPQLSQGGATDNQVLTWNNTAGEWQPAISQPATNLSAIGDVTITSVTDNEVLAYNSGSGQWINQTAVQAGLAEVGHTHTASDTVSGTFANARISESSVTQHEGALTITESQISDLTHYDSSDFDTDFATKTLSDISDVTVTTVTDNELLAYDNASGDWINQTAAEAGLSATGHTHATSDITSGTFADARIAQSNVTQHQAALTITESQISDLTHYDSTDFDTDFASKSTTDLSEGTNLYYTDGRADARIAAAVVNDLSDVVITTVADNEVLAYDSASGDWINQTASEAGLSEVGHTHAASDVTSGTFADARISQTSVTQHEAALTITESQISDLQNYLTAEVNDLTAAVTWANVPDANITQSSVTQHEDALAIDLPQLTQGGATDGQVLTWNNTAGEWEPDSSGSSNLGGLSDVTLTTPADNEVLAYDNASSEWINQTAAEAGLSETGHTHAASDVTSGTFADARISETSVTQHEAALTITESQISDLQSYLLNITSEPIGDLSDVSNTTPADRHVLVYDGVTDNRYENRLLVEADISDLQSYLTAEVNDLTSAVTWANVPDANITQSSVTQHEAALSIAASQVTEISNLTAAEGAQLENIDTTTITTTQWGYLGALDQGLTTTSDVTFDDLIVNGDLTVNGTTTTINTTELDIEDNIITLNVDETGSPTQNAGIEVERGTSTNASILWDETADVWKVGVVGSETEISLVGHTHAAADVTSGTFADARISQSSVTQHEGALTITESQISDLVHYDSSDFDTDFAGKSTTDLSEGTNLYYTDARADARIAAAVINDLSDVTITTVADDEVLTYDSGTGDWINETLAEAGIAATGHTHSTSDITSGTFADARISETSVTQHEAALTITESQISDLGSYITASSTDTLTNKTFDANGTGNSLSNVEVADLASGAKSGLDTTVVTGTAGVNGRLLEWNGDGDAVDSGIATVNVFDSSVNQPAFSDLSGTIADAQVPESAVTQHEAALTITESQISDLGSYITASSTDTLTNKTFDANGTGNSLSNVETADIASGSKSGNDSTLITGTAGTNGHYAVWNSDGDLVDGDDPTIVDLNNQTGTSYTIALSDAGNVVELNNASAITLTVPPNSTTAFPVGTYITLWQQGAGQVTVSEGSGVTVRTAETLLLRAQYSTATLIKRATDEWFLFGDLEGA